ncbi:peptidoglycan DD-metalloendopeptidase family protein [bacterium]|nr:hypothetical protein [Gemmatimonadota bacterium]MCH2665006.1 peptidoglycan DD-metalloendopeptidase family protein [bacterium]HCK10480.1 hypothetical protein [Candidatus Latescibacterota bacterium]
MSRLLNVAAIVVLMPNVVFAETLEEKLNREKAVLDSLNTMLEKEREELSQTEMKKLTIGARLDRIQREEFQARRELRGLSERERSLQARLVHTREALNIAERKLEERTDGIADRLRQSYKLARQNPLEILLSGVSLGEGLRRLKYLSRVAEQDRVDMAALASAKEDVRKALRVRQLQHSNQQTLVRAKERKRQDLEKSVTRYDVEIKQLERKESLYRSVIRDTRKDIETGEHRLAELIKQIERHRLAGRRLGELRDVDFPGLKGRLPWPVNGRILMKFGRVKDPELGTWTMNRGVAIAADAGTDVLAIAPGEVMLVDWWRGYGQLVLLRHPRGYYTLYSHLQSRSVEQGEILNEGALIGTVGSTGRLDGVPQLHFEIMEQEQALNPVEWLVP